MIDFDGQTVLVMGSGRGLGRLYALELARRGAGVVVNDTTTKSAVIGLTNSIALLGVEHGITANAVLPIGKTRMMTENAGARPPNAAVDALFDAATPERVVPMVAYLASRDCAVTHQCFSTIAGHYSRVFYGLGPGWTGAPGTTVSAEDICDHIDDIGATTRVIVPESVTDEIQVVIGHLGFPREPTSAL